jgi:plastocyanin
MRRTLLPSWGANLRRTFCITLLAALVVGAALAITRPLGSAHAATTCTTHTKRVVKHVKRHGRRQRVVGVKRVRACKPVPTPAPAPAPAPTPSTQAPATVPTTASAPSPPTNETPAATPPAPEPEPEANALGVAADDHGGVKSYTLSRGTVRAGRLTVQLQNKGEDPHDMEMQRVGPGGEPLGEAVEVPVTGPGEQKSESVTVEPGTYRMWCNLREHAKEGMEATVTVE